MRIVRAVEGGSSIRQAARRFAVSPSAAIKLMQRVRTTGSATPARFGGHRRRLLEPHETELRKMVEFRRAQGGARAALGHRRRALDDPQHAPPARPQA
jgi:putative transposase